ncbi:MAG: hypothetical protein KatS3mg001_154 [Candidatus Pacearchaeota archaeon]|nr:MAG: hypothetical protein KatS3mg001_154 [Candidatus Pacearchaeota archaeon]
MVDIFDNRIICKKCNSEMKKQNIEKNGFILRSVFCPKCKERIIHPNDEQEYKKFISLKNKEFKVKMRMVGNSYAVSIPKEIVSFIKEQERVMNNMVKLCFEDFGRLSLNFDIKPDKNTRVIKAREYKLVRNNKPIIHIKEFSDSANPKNNKKVYKLGDE